MYYLELIIQYNFNEIGNTLQFTNLCELLNNLITVGLGELEFSCQFKQTPSSADITSS